MVPFDISERLREEMAPHHRAVQAAIAVLANRHLGIEARPEGIGKFQGGVRVAGRDICIGPNAVADDKKRYNDDPKKEEEAVALAIGVVAQRFSRDGADSLAEFGGIDSLGGPYGLFLPDPLRAFFGFDGNDPPVRL
jgi:hypothetical protein